MGGAGEFVVRDPVPRENHGVAGDRASGSRVEVFNLDTADAALPDDAGNAGARGDGDLQAEPTRDRERGVGFGRGMWAGHQDGAAASFAERHRGGPADQLGSDDDGAGPGGVVLKV